MKNTMDKSLFFITLSCVCVWLIVDMAVGKNYLGSFLETIFPFMGDSGSSVSYSSDLSTGTVENAPSSSAAGANNEDNGVLNKENPYGAKRSNGTIGGRAIE